MVTALEKEASGAGTLSPIANFAALSLGCWNPQALTAASVVTLEPRVSKTLCA
jgi:hypothetical protein